jgi:predicted phosphodiesterase
MRYLILSDIHANLEALDACLTDARRRTFDRTLVLGDIVGYGADPAAVIDRVQSLQPAAIVRGNHDKVAIDAGEADGFNAVARTAALWMLRGLTQEHRSWLAELPKGPTIVDDLIEVCHGSTFDEDAYIFDEGDALRSLKGARRQVCFFGHTHYPVTFRLVNDTLEGIGPSPAIETVLDVEDGVKYLINPGSVGQPRDGDHRAAYAIADTDKRRVHLLRVEYPIEEAQAKIIAAGLPEVLAKRLGAGR